VGGDAGGAGVVVALQGLDTSQRKHEPPADTMTSAPAQSAQATSAGVVSFAGGNDLDVLSQAIFLHRIAFFVNESSLGLVQGSKREKK